MAQARQRQKPPTSLQPHSFLREAKGKKGRKEGRKDKHDKPAKVFWFRSPSAGKHKRNGTIYGDVGTAWVDRERQKAEAEKTGLYVYAKAGR
jgi:hypothetical protein